MTASMRQRTDSGITTGWKRRRPGLELGLTVIAACFIPLAAAVATGVGGGNKQSREVRKVSEHGGNGNTCFTAACNDTATMILNNMNRTVDPCDNFYMYACGGYLNSTKIPDGKDFENSYSSTTRKMYEKLRAIVEAEIVPNEPKAYKLVKKYYRSCINECANELVQRMSFRINCCNSTLPSARGVQPLLANLRRIGGWPMVEGASWKESNFDWTKAIYELRNSGHSFQNIIRFYVDVSQLNRTEHAIYIKAPLGFRAAGSSQMTNRFRETLRQKSELILHVAIRLGAPNNTDTKEDLEKAIKFESDLLMIPISQPYYLYYVTGIPTTLTELERNYPNIPWQEYISAMLPSTVTIPKNEVMILQTPIYFPQLDKLISITSKRVLANYIAYNTALDSISHVNEKQRRLAASEGNTVAPARRKMCIETVSRLPFALESMYMSRHLSGDAKNEVVSIMDNVKKAIGQTLNATSWLDPVTKSEALRKLDARRGVIAYAGQLSDDELNKIYEKLEMDEEKYYENYHKMSLFNMEYSLGKLRQTVEDGEFINKVNITSVGTVPNFNDTNNFAFTVGMLQDPFFSNDRPRYMNYGAIGDIIGGKIMEAFDKRGRFFNAKGGHEGWWRPSSTKELAEHEQCINDQYKNYAVQKFSLNVNGWTKFDESLTGRGATKGAYLAYSNWIAKNGEELKLPGIDMTPNQLFWISRANIACAKHIPFGRTSTIKGSGDSLREFKVNEPMLNDPQFATDFSCPPEANMNPTEKCSFW